MEQPTTPAEPPPSSGTRAARSSPRPRKSARHSGGFITRGSGVGLALQWRTFNLRREPRRDRRDPRRLDALPRRRRALAAARRARDLGHARGRARHVRPHRPPLHPVAEPVRRRQVVPQGGHVAAPAHRVLALRLALHDRLPDALRPHPVPARRPARRSRELRGQHRLGPQPGHHVRELLERADRRRSRAAAVHPPDQPHDRRDLHRADGADGRPADEVVRAGRRQLGRRDRPRARPGGRQGRGPQDHRAVAGQRPVQAVGRQARARPALHRRRPAPARRCSPRRSPRASTRRSWRCPARASRRRSSAWTSWPCSGWATRPRSSRASGAATASSSSTRSTPSACAAPRSGGANARSRCTPRLPMFGPRGTLTASGDVIIESREWRDYIGAQMAEADRPRRCGAARSARSPAPWCRACSAAARAAARSTSCSS